MDNSEIKSAMVRSRVEPTLKKDFKATLKAIGLSESDAITMFVRQVVMQHGMPFDCKIPNAETRKALAEDLTNAKRYASVDDLMDDI